MLPNSNWQITEDTYTHNKAVGFVVSADIYSFGSDAKGFRCVLAGAECAGAAKEVEDAHLKQNTTTIDQKIQKVKEISKRVCKPPACSRRMDLRDLRLTKICGCTQAHCVEHVLHVPGFVWPREERNRFAQLQSQGILFSNAQRVGKSKYQK